MGYAITTHQILLLAIGALVMLIAVVLQRYRLVSTQQRGGRQFLRWWLLGVAMFCFFAPSLLQWLSQR